VQKKKRGKPGRKAGGRAGTQERGIGYVAEEGESEAQGEVLAFIPPQQSCKQRPRRMQGSLPPALCPRSLGTGHRQGNTPPHIGRT